MPTGGQNGQLHLRSLANNGRFQNSSFMQNPQNALLRKYLKMGELLKTRKYKIAPLSIHPSVLRPFVDLLRFHLMFLYFLVPLYCCTVKLL